jgi:HK97 family phage major capsid protein
MGDVNDNEFPEIVADIQKQITALGTNTKENYEEIRKGYESMQALMKEKDEKLDNLVQVQVQKWAEDLSTREEARIKEIDAKLAEEKAALTKRLDAFEVAIKRPAQGSGNLEQVKKEEEHARQLLINTLAVRRKGSGVNFQEAQKLEVNTDQYKEYCDAFKSWAATANNTAGSVLMQHEKALSVGTDPDGGYTVTPVMSNRIIKRLFEMDPMRALATIESITTEAIEWLADYDDPGGGWESETVSNPNTATPTWNKKRIPVHVLAARPRATQTLLEDSSINIEQWLANKQANRFGRIEAAAFVNGDGVGKPRGFLTYDDYDTAGTDQWGRIERTNMGAPAALTADGFIDLKYSLIEQYLGRASWLMNRLTVAAAMQLKNGTGDYIWKPGLVDDRHSTILGSDVRMSTTMPQVAAGALSVAIADWAEAYMIVDRLGISVQRDPFTVKPYVEFYTRKRVGGDVINYQAIKIGTVAA